MYFVSRQKYWPDGKLCVEVASGGLDYCNPDALCARYKGEMQEYEDPREAVEVAIQICNQWREDLHSRKPYVSVGYTMGFTIPFEEGTYKHARAWAEIIYEKLTKCDWCGNIIKEKECYTSEYFSDSKYCSERCAEYAIADYQEQEEVAFGDCSNE